MPNFFGLDSGSRGEILEEFFFLMRRLGVSYEALRSMPVSYRQWFSRRLVKESIDSRPKDQYGLDDDTPISQIK